MPLNLTEASTDNINHGSGDLLDDISAGTVIVLLEVRATSNSFRQWLYKGTPFDFGKHSSGTHGGRYYLNIGRATTFQHIDIGTVLGVGTHFIAFTWDMGGSPHAYRGSLGVPAVADEANAVDGSGAQTSNAANDFRVGSDGTNANCIAWNITHVSLYNRVLTLAEIRAQQVRRRPVNGCVVFAEYGLNGSETVLDWSGYGHHGLVTGCTNAPVVFPPYVPQSALWAPPMTAASYAVGEIPC